MIGITGTNGKTTTTHLVSHLLMTAGHAAPVAGNVGRPLSDVVLDPILKAPGSVVVCEVSSYQLETIERFRPRVACVTNIAPDHLERYGTMDRYIEAKRWITVNQNEDDILVLNAEDAYCRSFVAHTRARVRHFSSKRPVAHGAFLENGALYFSFDNQDPPARIMSRDEIPLPGNHNVENVLAAIVVCQAMGLSLEVMADGVRSFQAVPHRIEKCGVVDGVEYYNDSKATNLDSMSKALESFDRPIVLIAGGRDKGSPWTVLNELVKRKVKALVLIGEAAPIGRKAWGALVREVEDAGGMEDAVRRARALAKAGDVVLLSPGCASFDMYKNFEERGDDFKRVVRDMAGVS
jgi:UDP-N-acetylmuramoylalanine--D-glutamate ligase